MLKANTKKQQKLNKHHTRAGSAGSEPKAESQKSRSHQKTRIRGQTSNRQVHFSSISVYMGQGGSGPVTGASGLMDGLSLWERHQAPRNSRVRNGDASESLSELGNKSVCLFQATSQNGGVPVGVPLFTQKGNSKHTPKLLAP